MTTNPSFQNYQTYLKIGELLSLQQPLSRAHDETLFIIVHQVYELWFKCMLHELEHAGELLSEDQPDRAASTLKRTLRIVKVLVSQLDVMETMTPLEFVAFRERLGASSGFQSAQFREIEFILGYKRPSVLEAYPEGSRERERLETRIASPTLWDEFVGLLARSGYSIPASTRGKWMRQPVAADSDVQAALIRVYRENPGLSAFCESLVDLDEGMQEWRYHHLRMVQRTIGSKTGTGGSSGAEYLLATVLAGPFFPDLWEVRDRF
ncbi:MAG: tryptophan 2,3-dioxygenase family protein [Gammaproteobacteria bacterium]|nr:tryptophan 2,3-dioxygenase family protein [Gammaproteobacteria bacterium]